MTRDKAMKCIAHFSKKCQKILARDGSVPIFLFAHTEEEGWLVQNVSPLFAPLHLFLILGGRFRAEGLRAEIMEGIRITLKEMHATGAVFIGDALVKRVKKRASPEEPPESGSLEVEFLGEEKPGKRAVIMQYDFLMQDGDHLSSTRFHFYRHAKNKVVLGDVVEDPLPLEGASPIKTLLEYPCAGEGGILPD